MNFPGLSFVPSLDICFITKTLFFCSASEMLVYSNMVCYNGSGDDLLCRHQSHYFTFAPLLQYISNKTQPVDLCMSKPKCISRNDEQFYIASRLTCSLVKEETSRFLCVFDTRDKRKCIKINVQLFHSKTISYLIGERHLFLFCGQLKVTNSLFIFMIELNMYLFAIVIPKSSFNYSTQPDRKKYLEIIVLHSSFS